MCQAAVDRRRGHSTCSEENTKEGQESVAMRSFNQRTQPSTFFWLTPGHPTSPAPYPFRWEELPQGRADDF